MKIKLSMVMIVALLGWLPMQGQAGTVDLTGFPTLTNDTAMRTDMGVTWTFDLIDSLVGNTWRTSGDDYLAFGGGSGSILIMDFSVNADVMLESFTIGCGLCINFPVFDIVDQSSAVVISSANNAGVGNGTTVLFNDGPLALSAGTTYRFNLTQFGAGIQRNFQSWQFSPTPVPLPGALIVMISGLLACFGVQRRK